MTGSIPDKMKVPGALWEGLKRVEFDRAEVVRRAALALTVLKDDTQISTAQFFALWRAIEAVSRDATIGLRIATVLDGAVMPLAFVAAQHARDFRDALNRVARFKPSRYTQVRSHRPGAHTVCLRQRRPRPAGPARST